jgi:hypothetical protein
MKAVKRKLIGPILFRLFILGLLTFIIFVPSVLLIKLWWVLAIIPIGFIAILFPAISQYVNEIRTFITIYRISKYNPKAAMKMTKSEMKDIQMLYNVGATEMDVHSLNATDEGRAMKSANRGRASQFALYGLYESIHVILEEKVKEIEAQSNVVDDLFERY